MIVPVQTALRVEGAGGDLLAEVVHDGYFVHSLLRLEQSTAQRDLGVGPVKTAERVLHGDCYNPGGGIRWYSRR